MMNRNKISARPLKKLCRTYQIKVKGHLDSHWSEWFDNLAVNPTDSGETIISGLIPDQAALFGILNKIRDLSLPLLSVNCRGANPAADEINEQ